MKSEEREQIRNQHAAERQATSDARDTFHLGLASGDGMDKFLAILQGKYKAPSIPGEPARIKAANNVTKKAKVSLDSLAADDVSSTSIDAVGHVRTPISSQQQVPSKYAQLIQQLERFAFSEDPAKRRKQMTAIETAVHKELVTLIAQDVYERTKTAFGSYLKEFFMIPGGVKAIFDFQGDKIRVIAKGSFYGEETIAVDALDNGDLVGKVLKIASNDEKIDLSHSFDITAGKI